MPKKIDSGADMQQVISDWRNRKSDLERDIRMAKYHKDRRAQVDAEEKIKEERPYIEGGEEICTRCDLVSMVCTGRAPRRDVLQGEYHYKCLACYHEDDFDQFD